MLKREIREEIGVDIDILECLGYTDHIIEGQHWVAIHHLAKIRDGQEPKNMEPNKHEDMRWFPPDKLPKKLTQTTKEPVDIYLKKMIK